MGSEARDLGDGRARLISGAQRRGEAEGADGVRSLGGMEGPGVGWAWV